MHAALRRWFVDRGGLIHPALHIEERPGDGRGIYVDGARFADGLEPGTRVLQVPSRCLLSSEDAKAEVPRSCWEADEWADTKLLPEDLSALALWLLHEKRKAATSSHCAYLASLPSEQDVQASFSLWWPDEKLASLRCAELALHRCGLAMDNPAHDVLAQRLCKDASELRSLVRSQHLLLRKRASTANWQVPTIDEYKWAWCIVNSRSFDCDEPSDMPFAGGVERRSVLAPFVDMLNHGREGAGRNCRWFFVGEDLCVEVVHHVGRGEQLLFDYNSALSGRFPLDQSPPFYFLLYYGFGESVRNVLSYTAATRSLM